MQHIQPHGLADLVSPLMVFIKKRSQLFMLVSFLLTAFSIQSYGQEEIGVATIDSDMLIVLDSTSALVKSYEASLSNIDLKNEESTNDLFNSLMDNLVMFEVDYKNRLIKIKLMTEYMPEWGVVDWNKYFEAKSEMFLADKK